MPYIWKRKEWPHFTWQNDALIGSLGKARFAQGALLSKVATLGLELNRGSRLEILVEETIKTAAIEGEKLDQAAVRSSVARRLGVPTAGVKREDRNAEGLIDVILDATANYDKPLTLQKLKDWQRALFPTGRSGLRKVKAGQWRGKAPMHIVSGPVGREKIHYEAPPSDRIGREMKGFVDWWRNGAKDIDGLIRAGIAHFYFVTIHPFEDGNGRVARAVTEMALAGDEKSPKRYYSLSSRIMKERDGYYDVLERCQKGPLDITVWLVWFLNCFLRAIGDSEAAISKVLKISGFWSEHYDTTLNDNQRKVINRILEAGPDGFEGGLTTRKYVALTRSSRATAYRDITYLMEKGILEQAGGKGRSMSYRLRFP